MLFLCFAGAVCMLHKTSRPYDPSLLPPDERLKRNIADLYASNVLSGARAVELLSDAAHVGAQACRRFRKRCKHARNDARSLQRDLLKHNTWPKLYEAKVRVWDTKKSKMVEEWICFWLPHEILATLATNSVQLGNLYENGHMDPMSKEHLLSCEQAAGMPLVGLGLWGDGAPCNWDRTESLEVFALNLPGLGNEFKTLRIPITALSKKNVANASTFDDIFEVVAWSLRHCALGVYPQARHDGRPWRHSDKLRRSLFFAFSLHSCFYDFDLIDWPFF